MSTYRLAILHQRIGVLTEERDALARVVEAFIQECGPRFGDPGHQLVGELAAEHGLAFAAADRVHRETTETT